MNDLLLILSHLDLTLCRRALGYQHPRLLSPGKYVYGIWKLHAKVEAAGFVGGVIAFGWAEALLLDAALGGFMDAELQETSLDYKRGQGIRGVLDDYCHTHMAVSVEQEKRSAPVEGLSAAAEEARAFDARMKQKRDAGLREVFLGKAVADSGPSTSKENPCLKSDLPKAWDGRALQHKCP